MTAFQVTATNGFVSICGPLDELCDCDESSQLRDRVKMLEDHRTALLDLALAFQAYLLDRSASPRRRAQCLKDCDEIINMVSQP